MTFEKPNSRLANCSVKMSSKTKISAPGAGNPHPDIKWQSGPPAAATLVGADAETTSANTQVLHHVRPSWPASTFVACSCAACCGGASWRAR